MNVEVSPPPMPSALALPFALAFLGIRLPDPLRIQPRAAPSGGSVVERVEVDE